MDAIGQTEQVRGNAKAALELMQQSRARAAERKSQEAELLAALDEMAQRRAEGVKALFVDLVV